VSNLDSHSKRGKYDYSVREYGADENMLAFQRGSERSWWKIPESDLQGLCLWPDVISLAESRRI